jgi:hypothetical protein
VLLTNVTDHTRGNAGHNGVIGYVVRDHSARANEGLRADGYASRMVALLPMAARCFTRV